MKRVFIKEITEGQPKVFSATGYDADDTYTERPYFQHVGFSSIPKAESQGIVIEYRNAVYLIATQDSSDSRPTLSDPGDVCVYTDANNYIKIAADGSITVITDGKSVKVENGSGIIELETSGKVSINGGKLTVEAGT